MDMRFIPDEPIFSSADDSLGFEEIVNLILNSIENTQTPFVYGILGDWGTGKTSLMRLLENHFNEKLKNHFNEKVAKDSSLFIPIWFDAWQYENEDNIIYPLLYIIQKDFEKRVDEKKRSKKFGTDFMKIVTSSFLALADLGLRVTTKHFTGEALKLEDVEHHIKSVENEANVLGQIFNKWADQVSKLKDNFERLLYTYADEFKKRSNELIEKDIKFVILIDDLDRCMPNTAIGVIESIKNFLSVKNSIFLLGLNPKVINKGIRIKYSGLEIEGREYLEKILNFSFYVPEPEPNKLIEFVKNKLNELVIKNEEQNQLQKLFDEFSDILKVVKFNNPRKIKRILNRYLLLISKYPTVKEFTNNCTNKNIVKLIILSEYFPQTFFILKKSCSDRENLRDIINDLNSDDTAIIKKVEDNYGISLSNEYAKIPPRLFKIGLTKTVENDIIEVFKVARIT